MRRRDILYALIIFGLASFLFQTCAENIEKKDIYKVYNVKDTTTITKRDTIHFIDTVKHTVYAKVYTPFYDTLGKSYIYNNPVDDSLIGGNIQTTFIDCRMVRQKLNYIPKFPKYIIDSTIVTIHDSTYVERTITEPNRTKIGLGISASYTAQPNIYANILVKTKKDNIFGIGYDPFQKTILFQINKLITFKGK